MRGASWPTMRYEGGAIGTGRCCGIWPTLGVWVCCAIYVTGEHRFVWQMCCDLHESCAMNCIFMSQVCYDLCDRCAVTDVTGVL